MGASSSRLEKALTVAPEKERFFGLENFGNTCYANSVLQILYWCEPFREQLIQYCRDLDSEAEDTLLMGLGELFSHISQSKKRSGVASPSRLLQLVRKQNEMFSGNEHQDAHEFLNWVLNDVSETIDKVEKKRADQGNGAQPLPAANGVSGQTSSWFNRIFQGTLVNETRCLGCETVSCRQETFLDLSLEILPNSSVSSCLRNFSETEMLGGRDKFFCDTCGCLQEAQKRMKVQRPPNVLVLHLKRFKYVEHLGRIKKLPHRVAFPPELRLGNVVYNAPGASALYQLCGIVVHVGAGPYHGHYVTLIKSHDQWLFFDDESVNPVSEDAVWNTFGSSSEAGGRNDHAFLLTYIRRPEDWDHGPKQRKATA
ncbi:unnamed protein product [Pedinophyceae sp. YPF-701]|nr:unnamed protein product [Pedinophyceae sp. YPF-701]